MGDNITMNLQEVRCRGMVWIALAKARGRWLVFMNTAMNAGVP
jgi:hypothetical protein